MNLSALRTSGLLFLVLVAASRMLAGEDNPYKGTWRGPSRFGAAEQVLIIDKVGGQWYVIGLVLDKGKRVTQFNSQDVTFDAEKGLSYREAFKMPGTAPAQVTLILDKDKTQLRAVTVLPDKTMVEYKLKKDTGTFKGSDLIKKPEVKPPVFAADDIARLEGTWQGKLSFEVDMFWTLRRTKDDWKVAGELKKGDKLVARFDGVSVKADSQTKEIVFTADFKTIVYDFGSKATFAASANANELQYRVLESGKINGRTFGPMFRVGMETPPEKPPIPIVKNPVKKPMNDADVLGAGGGTGLAFTPNGKQLVAGNQRGSVHVMNVEDEKIVQTIDAHKDGVSALSLSPNGKILATGGRDKLVKLWDLETGKLLHTLEGFNRPVTAVTFSGDGNLIAAAEAQATQTGLPPAKIMIWQATDGKRTMVAPSDATGLAFSPDGKTLVSNGGRYTNPKMGAQTIFSIQFWNIKGTLAGAVQGNVGIIYRVRWAPTGTLIAWSGENNQVFVYDRATSKVRFVLPVNERYIHDLAFTRDGKKLVTLAEKGVVRVWDMGTGKQIATSEDHLGPVRHLALSPDGTRYAVAGAGQPHVAIYALPK